MGLSDAPVIPVERASAHAPMPLRASRTTTAQRLLEVDEAWASQLIMRLHLLLLAILVPTTAALQSHITALRAPSAVRAPAIVAIVDAKIDWWARASSYINPTTVCVMVTTPAVTARVGRGVDNETVGANDEDGFDVVG